MNAYTFPDHLQISDAAKDMITRILNNDPAKRPSLEELLCHEFLNHGGSIP
jgi:polo-like kinase 1